ncbi:Coatomer, alpha subunit [Hortaea werneckii]|nr:Coatomer, alpha subunit [Hortaea werneckii]
MRSAPARASFADLPDGFEGFVGFGTRGGGVEHEEGKSFLVSVSVVVRRRKFFRGGRPGLAGRGGKFTAPICLERRLRADSKAPAATWSHGSGELRSQRSASEPPAAPPAAVESAVAPTSTKSSPASSPTTSSSPISQPAAASSSSSSPASAPIKPSPAVVSSPIRSSPSAAKLPFASPPTPSSPSAMRAFSNELTPVRFVGQLPFSNRNVLSGKQEGTDPTRRTSQSGSPHHPNRGSSGTDSKDSLSNCLSFWYASVELRTVKLLGHLDGNIQIPAFQRKLEASLRILDELQGDLGVPLLLEIGDNALPYEGGGLDNVKHLVIVALDERQLEAVLGRVDGEELGLGGAVETVDCSALDTHEVDGVFESADDAIVAVHKSVFDVVQGGIEKDTGVVPGGAFYADRLKGGVQAIGAPYNVLDTTHCQLGQLLLLLDVVEILNVNLLVLCVEDSESVPCDEHGRVTAPTHGVAGLDSP